MYPNKNIGFYSVPTPSYPSHHGYPYSLYIQPNHGMNFVASSAQSSAAPASCSFEDIFSNGAAAGLTAATGSCGPTNFQEFYPKPTEEPEAVTTLPKYFRCTLGEGPARYRRERTVFTQNQLRAFEKRFEAQKYLSTQERFDLARSLGLSPLQVKTWFQNRRMKWKRTAKSQQTCSDKEKQAKDGPKDNQALYLSHDSVNMSTSCHY